MIFSSVILAGGQSRRTGDKKTLLTLDGQSFIESIYNELEGLGERFISVNKASSHPELAGYPLVSDSYPNSGPLGGLHAALKNTVADAILVVSSDLPFFTRELGEKLQSLMEPGVDAVVPHTLDGRTHPLCAVYAKSCLEAFEFQLRAKNYRIKDALDKINTKYYFAQAYATGLTSINSPEEYAMLCKTK